MIPLFVIILVAASTVSMWIGYDVGRRKRLGQKAVLHYLRSEIRALIFTRQNWTAREISSRIASTLGEIENSMSVKDLKSLNVGLKGYRRLPRKIKIVN